MFLAATARGAGASCSMIIMLILFFGLMWFFVIRPEKKKLHEKSEAMRSAKKKEKSKLNKEKLKDYAVYALLCIIALAGLVLLFGSMGAGLKGAIIGAVILFIVLVIVFKISQAADENNEKEKRKREEDARRFDSGEMKGAERAAYAKKQMDDAWGAYNRGVISYLGFEALRKKYTGKSMIDDFGLDFIAAQSRKAQINSAIKKQQKSATRSMIINAAVGEAIAGTAGAVIGAATSAEKSAQEAAALAAEKAAAEQNFRAAAEDFLSRK